MAREPDRRRWRLRQATVALLVIVVLIGLMRTVWVSADGDSDGLADCTEQAGLQTKVKAAPWRTDPVKPDTDGDGVVDGEEVHRVRPKAGVMGMIGRLWSCTSQTYSALSDPTLKDTDGDRLGDARELSDGSDAFAKDSDADGLTDANEREWASDPQRVDTDGDGIHDGDDVADGYTPVEVNLRIHRKVWSREYAEGIYFGDFREIDSIPQLLGSLSGGASSAVPVVGWISGTIADSRDLAANLIDGDWVSAGASGAGLVPYLGDSAKLVKQLTRFAGRYPDKVRSLGSALASWRRIPVSVRVKMLRAVDPVSVDRLRKHELKDDVIVQFAKRGTQLATLVVLLDRAAGSAVRGVPSANADADGFVSTSEEAANALREYAREVDDTSDVDDEAVYVGGFPKAHRTGGRLIDSCTKCTPHPKQGLSTLRVAKHGSQRYSGTVRDQINKDAVLRSDGYAVEWHFFAGRTGCSIDPLLLDALDVARIPYHVHLPS